MVRIWSLVWVQLSDLFENRTALADTARLLFTQATPWLCMRSVISWNKYLVVLCGNYAAITWQHKKNDLMTTLMLGGLGRSTVVFTAYLRKELVASTAASASSDNVSSTVAL